MSIHVDRVLGQRNTTDRLSDSVVTGLAVETERHTIQSLHKRSLHHSVYVLISNFAYSRSYGQVPSRCWLDVHWMGTALSTILHDGQSSVLPSLLSSAHVWLYAIWLAATSDCPLFHNI